MSNSFGKDILIQAEEPMEAASFYVKELGFEITSKPSELQKKSKRNTRSVNARESRLGFVRPESMSVLGARGANVPRLTAILNSWEQPYEGSRVIPVPHYPEAMSGSPLATGNRMLVITRLRIVPARADCAQHRPAEESNHLLPEG
jgi:hypothetical protein